MKEAAKRLRDDKIEIIGKWEKEIRKRIAAASKELEPVLIDTLPVFISNLAEAVEKNDVTKLALDGSTLAGDHGAERANLTKYTPENIIVEYQILRETIFAHLEQHGVLSQDAQNIISKSLEDVCMLSIRGFFERYAAIKEQFILTLSHDLRTPLTSAKIASDMITRTSNDPEKVEKLGRSINLSLKRIDSMIHTLLDSSRLRVGEKLNITLSEFDLLALVSEVIDEQRFIHGDRFKVKAPPELQVRWDREGIKRVLENLLANAVKYGGAHSDITLTVENQFQSAFLLIHNYESFIPMLERDHLFSMFRQIKTQSLEKKEGWGMGLLMVKGVVEAHAGSVTIESDQERGTTFIVKLPLEAPAN